MVTERAEADASIPTDAEARALTLAAQLGVQASSIGSMRRPSEAHPHVLAAPSLPPDGATPEGIEPIKQELSRTVPESLTQRARPKPGSGPQGDCLSG